jgi:hypothetical protein
MKADAANKTNCDWQRQPCKAKVLKHFSQQKRQYCDCDGKKDAFAFGFSFAFCRNAVLKDGVCPRQQFIISLYGIRFVDYCYSEQRSILVILMEVKQQINPEGKKTKRTNVVGGKVTDCFYSICDVFT